jgi:hypothetical protein
MPLFAEIVVAVTTGIPGFAVADAVTTGVTDPVPGFCVVVHPEVLTSRITMTAKKRPYSRNFIMFNLKKFPI